MIKLFLTGVVWLLSVVAGASYAQGSAAAAADSVTVRYFQLDARYRYQQELLSLILDKTREPGAGVTLQPVDTTVTQGRGLIMLENAQVDVAYLPTSREREVRFRAIKIPIMRGLLGYRLLMIHKDARSQFERVKSLKQLREQTSVGFGTHWADADILRHNRLSLVTNSVYANLFKMLDRRRFDYFPRGLHEAWQELAQFSPQYPALMIEPHLALYYPLPVYFFVHRDNAALAERLERGLRVAMADGSFRQLFDKHFQQVLQMATLEQRQVIALENPEIPTPTDAVSRPPARAGH